MPMTWRGRSEFDAALKALEASMLAATRLGLADAAAAVVRHAQEHASGRPGPDVVSGTLRRGIQMGPIEALGAMGWQVEVGPTVVYSRRIELGFHGVDSLGRSYDQPGYPFFEPGYREVEPELERTFTSRWAVALEAV
jgi:hypothetical protein